MPVTTPVTTAYTYPMLTQTATLAPIEIARQINQRISKDLGLNQIPPITVVEYNSSVGSITYSADKGYAIQLDKKWLAHASNEEIAAVVAHELGHLALQHLPKRFRVGLSLGVILAITEAIFWISLISTTAIFPFILMALAYPYLTMILYCLSDTARQRQIFTMAKFVYHLPIILLALSGPGIFTIVICSIWALAFWTTTLVPLNIMRHEEFAADYYAAQMFGSKLTHQALGLVLKNRARRFGQLFETHPAKKERLQRLNCNIKGKYALEDFTHRRRLANATFNNTRYKVTIVKTSPAVAICAFSKEG